MKSDKYYTIKRGLRSTVIRKEKFLQAMDSVMGNVLAASQIAGINRDTAYTWRHDDKVFSEKWSHILYDSIDQRIDLAYDKLDEAVRKGNIRAIIHTLKKFRPEVYKC